MRYSPVFLLKKRPIFDPFEFKPNRHKQSRKEIEIILQVYRRRFREFGAISRTYQNLPCSKPWAIAQAFAQKRPTFEPCELRPNRHKQSRKELEIILQGFSRRFREFGAICRTGQNPPCSKPWATAQLLLKIGQYPNLMNLAEIDTNSRARN